MKHLLIALLLLSFSAFAQKVSFNEYDKFIKQRRIEFEPLPILSSKTANVSLTYKSIGTTFYVILNGFGWGEATIDDETKTIFLLSNDSTVTVKSTGLQTYTVGALSNSYRHQYFITRPDIEMLNQYEIVGIRKYSTDGYVDMDVPKESAVKLKKLSTMFIEELKKAGILFTLKNINLKDIANYVDDSVKFCSKVFSTRFFEFSEGKPTILDVNEDYNNQLLNTVIWGEDRKNFANVPESLYTNKEVCISGVVKLVNNKPQISIRNREQISVKSPISVKEVPWFVGDSVTVRGKVLSGRYLQNGRKEIMLLNMGAAYSNQLLTVVMEDIDRTHTTGQPENYYLNKEIYVTGQISVFENKPQMVVHNREQVVTMGADFAAATSTGNPTPVVLPAGKDIKKEPQILERPTEFPGGLHAFKTFLRNNLQAPPELQVGESKIVFVQFLVGMDGSVTEFKIIQSAGSSFDTEAIRVLKKMPKWVPALKDGHPVVQIVTQPLNFLGE